MDKLEKNPQQQAISIIARVILFFVAMFVIEFIFMLYFHVNSWLLEQFMHSIVAVAVALVLVNYLFLKPIRSYAKRIADAEVYKKKMQAALMDGDKRLQVESQKLLMAKKEAQMILDSVPAWIVYKDRENRFVRVNKTFADVMKMPKEKLEGKSLFDFFPKEQAEVYWRDDKEVMASGKPKMNIVEPMESPNGTMWLRTDKIPYKDESGKIIGIIAFAVDITELKKSEDKMQEIIKKLEMAKESDKRLQEVSQKLVMKNNP